MSTGNRWSSEKYTAGYVLGTDYTNNDTTGRQETVEVGVKIGPPPQDNTIRQVTKTYFDDLARRTYVVENWQTSFDPTGGGAGNTAPDKDRITAWTYNGVGQVTTLTARNDSASDQVTEYKFKENADR